MKSTSSASRPQVDGGAFHLRMKPGDLAPHCIIVGSPERADRIAREHLKDVRAFTNPREIRAYTGRYHGVEVSVLTHHLGTTYCGLVMDEAMSIGTRRFIRVGSCSALVPWAKVGDVMICNSAIRNDGASLDWAPRRVEARARLEMHHALTEAATIINSDGCNVGIGVTTSDFYWGQGRPDIWGRPPPPALARRHRKYLNDPSITAYDMENAGVFLKASLAGEECWAGSVMAIYGNRHSDELVEGAGDDFAIEVGLGAMLAIAMGYPL